MPPVRGFANSRKDPSDISAIVSSAILQHFATRQPGDMNQPPPSEYVPGQPGSRFDPYVRLVRSLLPRTSCVAMFGASGELIWSTDTMTGPDLMNIVDDALLSAGANPGSAGQLRLLAGNLPVYLCSLRDEAQQLLAMLAVVCRRPSDARAQGPGLHLRLFAAGAGRSSACGAT